MRESYGALLRTPAVIIESTVINGTGTDSSSAKPVRRACGSSSRETVVGSPLSAGASPRSRGFANPLLSAATVILCLSPVLIPRHAYAASKVVTVKYGANTETVVAFYAIGLALCTPVPGLTGAITIQPQHGTATVVGGSYTQVDCGDTQFPGMQANYTWTDSAGLPGSGSDYFHVQFTAPPGYSGTADYDITICLNFSCEAPCPLCPLGNAVQAIINTVGQAFGGEPINIGTGDVYYQVTDYQTAGQNPLSFIRYYRSAASITSFARTVGGNWRSNWDHYIDFLSSTVVLVERGNGQSLNFVFNGASWVPDTDVDVTLVQSGSTWTLTDENDTVETYTSMIIPVLGLTLVSPNGAGLNSIRYRNGYTQTLSYNGSDQLTSVVDSYNRTLSFSYGSGLLSQVTTPDATTISFTYTPAAVPTGGTIVLTSSNLSSATYSTTPATSQTYLYENTALPFALTGIIDENGNRFATWSYDSQGRGLTSQTGAGADLTTVTYDDTDGTRTLTNAVGQVESFTFTTLQNVPKVTQITRQSSSSTAAATETFTYDSNGYIATETDWNGNQTSYVNNSHGLPTSATEAAGSSAARVTTIAYNPTFVHLPATITTPGVTATFTYDAAGDQLTRTLTDTTTTTAPYSTSGQERTWTNTWNNFLLASTKTPKANTTTFNYDSSGALTKITNALNQATSITTHTGGGLPLTIVDPNGVTTTLTYNARQWPLTSTISTSEGPLTTTWTYDAAGNLINTTLPDNSRLAETYDTAHRVITVTDSLRNAISYSLDALGDQTQVNILNAGGTVQRKHSRTFDALGRTLQDIGGVGQTTDYTFDSNGNTLTVTDPLSHVTTRTFDALNRLSTSTDANSGEVTYTYDAHDRPLTVTDPIGGKTTYVYDGFGDLIQQASPASGTTVYHYDPDSNLVQKTDARGSIGNYTYDALDRIASVSYPADAPENVTYSYDQTGHGFGIGKLTSVSDATGTLSRSYDERGNLLAESRGQATVTLNTGYTYDAASRIASIAYPSGSVVTYSRDAAGKVTTVTAQPKGAPTASALLSNIAYQAFGPPNALTYGNGVTESRVFDLDYRMTGLVGSGNNPIQNLAYGFDAANNVLSITDGVTSAESQAFGYDVLNRLKSATGGYGSLGYNYDANGNRLTESPTVTPGTALPLDGLGGVTTLTYNQAGWLASASAGATTLTQYTYDAFGQRSMKVGSLTATTLFQYDQVGHLLEEADNLGNLKADYIYLGNRPIGEISGTGNFYFLHDDRIGTPQTATDSAQSVAWIGNYQPFGALNVTTSQTAQIGQDLRFPGQENDVETGLYHNGFRDYVPGLGVYAVSDPIGLSGGFNSYLYADGSPVNVTDARGLKFQIYTLVGGHYFAVFDTASYGRVGFGFAPETTPEDLLALFTFAAVPGQIQSEDPNALGAFPVPFTDVDISAQSGDILFRALHNLKGDVIPYQAETANCINAAIYMRRLALLLRAKELNQAQ